MRKWISGQELLQLRDWTALELLDCIKNGLPAYVDEIGRRLIDRDTLPLKKLTLEEIEKVVRSKFKPSTKFVSLGDGWRPNAELSKYLWPYTPTVGTRKNNETDESDEETISKLCKRLYEGPITEPVVPPGCKALSFSMLTNIETSQLLHIINSLRFKYQDLVDFAPIGKLFSGEQKDSCPLPSECNTPIPPKQIDTEKFIRSLSVSYENDEEIKIKVANQRARSYSDKELGYNKTMSQEWRLFIHILRSPDHSYHIGVAHGAADTRNKSYDANRRKLVEISKKFVSFLNRTYEAQLPDGFKIFERIKNGPRGTYRFKFTISDYSIDTAQHGALSKDELMKEIERLSKHKAALEERGDEDSEKKEHQIEDELNAAVIKAIDNGWLDRNRAKSYLNPQKESIFPAVAGVYEEDKKYRNDY